MHAVGHVGDRARPRPRGRATAPCHISRATSPCRAADAVGRAAGAQRELRDAERLVVVVGFVRPRRDELPDVDAELAGAPERSVGDLVGRVRVVARRHRRVGGEDRARAGRRERVVGRAPLRSASPRASSRQAKRGVALVEVDDRRVDAERAQRPHAADAEQRVLGEPDVRVADVQARRDPAVGRRVLGPVGVEQQQRHAPDVDPPDLRDDLAGRRPARSTVSGCRRRRSRARRARVGVGVDPVLVLPAAERRCAGGSSRGGT